MPDALDYRAIHACFQRLSDIEPEPKGELEHRNAFTLLVARHWRSENDGRLSVKHVLLLIFAPFFFGMLGKDAVTVGVPLVHAAVAGHPSELPFVVEKAEGFSDRKCPNEIELADMPLVHDKLCGFPESFRETLSPGQTVLVSGRGTAWGIFVDRARGG